MTGSSGPLALVKIHTAFHTSPGSEYSLVRTLSRDATWQQTTRLAAMGIGRESERKLEKKNSRDARWHGRTRKTTKNKLSGTKRLSVPMHFISVLFCDGLTQGKCTGRSDLYVKFGLKWVREKPVPGDSGESCLPHAPDCATMRMET